MKNTGHVQNEFRARAIAGKALIVFLCIMIALTWGNNMLQEMTIATIATTTIQKGALEKQVSASGTLASAHVVPVIAEESARVMDVLVTEGGLVREGGILFILDYTDLVAAERDAVLACEETMASKQQSLNWAAADLSTLALNRVNEKLRVVAEKESGLLAAQAALDAEDATEEQREAYALAKEAYDAELVKLDSDTQTRDYVTKYGELGKAQASLADAKQAYAALLDATVLDEASGRYTLPIRSPVDGSVVSSSISNGTMVATSSPAITLHSQEDGLVLCVQVTESQAEEMAIGDEATISAGSGKATAQIDSIAISTVKEGMFDVTFTLPGDMASVGMKATMDYRKRTQSYDIIIPLSALHSDGSGDFVYVVEQSDTSLGAKLTVRRVDVTVLATDNSRAALQGGISQKDTIVVRSNRDIADGDRVRLEE